MTKITTDLFTPKHTVRAFVKSLDVKAKTQQGWFSSISKMEEFLGRPALLRDLNDETFSAFRDWLEEVTKLAPVTKSDYRRVLVIIADRAASMEIIMPPSVRMADRGSQYPSGDSPRQYNLLRYFEDHYVIDRQQGDDPLTPSTLKSYRSAVQTFRRFDRRAKMRHINSAKIRAFRKWLLDRGMNPKKAGNHAFAVASIVKHATPERFIEQADELTPAIDPTRTLAYVFEKNYLPAKQKIASDKTLLKYLATFNSFGRFLGHIATLDDLTDENVGAFMRDCRGKGNAAITANGYRSKLLAFWTWCAKRRIVVDFPTVEKMPEPAILPTARDLNGLKKLLAGCARMPGHVCGIPAPQWWRMLHLIDWDTCGERTGALLDIRWDWLDWETGHLSIPAGYRKGGKKPNLCKLKPATLRELRSFREPVREQMFPWDMHIGTYHSHYKRMLKLAGLPYVPYKSGMQMHRRTFATHLEMIGGNATDALRHSERGITVDSYIDPKLLNRAPANEQLFSLAEIA